MGRLATFLGLTLALAVFVMTRAYGQDSSAEKKAAVAQQQPKSDAVTRLLRIQLQAAQKAYRGVLETIAVQDVGGLLVQVKGDTKARPDLVYLWSVRWLHAQRDLGETKEQRLAAFVEHQKRMQKLSDAVHTIGGGGGILQDSDLPSADWYLAEAELWLLKEQGK
jgi:hypothetical protein